MSGILQQDLIIDEYELIKEWLNQAKLFNDYAQIKSDVDYALSKAKENLDVVSAEIRLDIVKDPEIYGIKKYTEKILDALIFNEEDYKEQKNIVMAKTYERDMASNAVKAIEMRKSALENIVKLHGQNYFATPSEAGISGQVISEMKDEDVKSKMKARMSKKGRS